MSFVSTPADRLKCILATKVLRNSGELRLRVTGSSMVPSVWPGDLLLIRAVEFLSISPGDVVLFFRDNRFFVHRVQATFADRLLTRGDGVAVPDPPVASDELLGRVAAIVRDGVMCRPSPLGAAGRLLAFGARHSTAFCKILLRLQPICRRLLHPSTLCTTPFPGEA